MTQKRTVKKVTKKVAKKKEKKPEEKQELDMVTLLEIQNLSAEAQELGLREFRIRGIDKYLAETKKTMDADEKDALKKYLRMCPPIEQLTEHMLSEHPKSKQWFSDNAEKLKKKIASYQEQDPA